MKTLKIFVLLLSTILYSCSETQRTRNFGETLKVNLQPNEILINCSWGNNNLWFLTKDTITNIDYFRKYSIHSIWEGTVIIK